jgi:MoaA/NifB/PqqE/SkfB family radical SAM enzyme
VRPRIRSGVAALPVQLRFCLDVLWKWLFHRSRYPLLSLSHRTGFLATLRLLNRLHLTKAIQVGRYHHFSLLEPRWPSPAYDRLIARGGLNLAAAGTSGKKQVDLAILAVSRVCDYGCAYCYERFNLGDREIVPAARWREVIRQLQEIGVSVIALSGGEPLLRFEDTLDLLDSSDKRRSDFHIFTTGHGATQKRVTDLARAGLAAAGVGLDHYDRHLCDAARGYEGAFDEALVALTLFREAGLLTYVNVCLSRPLMKGGGLWRLYDLAHALGVGAVQLLEPKPCGGFSGRDPQGLFGAAEKRAALEFFETANRKRRYGRHPAVYFPAFMEAPENLGCMMGGLSHLYVDSLGNVEPCLFLPVSFGNVLSEDFSAIYARMRAEIPRPLHRPCPSFELAATVGFDPRGRGGLPIAHASIQEEWHRLSHLHH